MSTCRKYLVPILAGAGWLGMWEVYVHALSVDPLLLPPPSAILVFALGHAEELLSNGVATGLVLLLGLALGIGTGFGLGVAMHLLLGLRKAIYPWLVISQMIPVPAIAPVLVLWFGYTLAPKVLVVVLICFFPIAVSTVDGLRGASPDRLRMLRAFGASPWQLLTKVEVPGALPRIFSGLRVAIALSVVAAVFGEWVGSTRGLGYLILHYNNRLETAGLLAAIGVLSLLGLLLYALAGVAERILLPWARDLEERRP